MGGDKAQMLKRTPSSADARGSSGPGAQESALATQPVIPKLA